jgi:single-strand DNA-binding protein
MGRGVNKAIIVGTLGRDPEMRYMPNGNAVVNMSLATDESYNDKATGQKVEQTEWHRITAYGKLAEIIGQYLKKGSKAYIEGKLKTRKWEKDGVERYSTEIVANDMMMLDGRNDNVGGMGGMGGGQPMNQSPSQSMGQGAPSQNMATPNQGHQTAQYQNSNMSPPAQQGYSQPAPAQAPQQAPQSTPNNSFDDFDDDIPF